MEGRHTEVETREQAGGLVVPECGKIELPPQRSGRSIHRISGISGKIQAIPKIEYSTA
jgi:hypothetical protein